MSTGQGRYGYGRATAVNVRYGGSTAMAQDKWIAKAVPESRRGVFTAKAKRAGMGVQQFARSVRGRKRKGKPVPTELLREAILAQRFKKMASKKR